MTSWPWMKEVDAAITDPIPPVNEHDKRLSVKDLIVENRDKIDKVKSDLVDDPLYDPKKHDDLWILRFVLSHKKKKNMKNATKAAKTTLLFRKEHKLDEWGDIRDAPPGIDIEQTKQFVKYYEEGSFRLALPDSKRGLLLYLRIAGIDGQSLVKNIDESAWLPNLTYFTEFCHQWLDYITRTTGRLTKQLRIVDLDGISISQISMEQNRRDGKAMTVMEDCYPQLLQQIFLCNSPSWIQIPWRIARPLLPKRVVEKLDFINPFITKERNRVLEFISEEHLPERFGGKNHVWPLEFDPSKTQK